MIELTYQHNEAVNDFLKNVNPKKGIEGLEALVRGFLRFPYENITKIIRHKNATDENGLFRLPEIVSEENREFGAGGTCFSLTYYFETILKYLGYDCYTVLVDRSYGENTHCALIVRNGPEKYLVDPGYCLSRPIPLLDKEMEYKLPHNTYIVTPAPSPLPSPSRGEGEGGGEKKYIISTTQLGRTKPRYILKDTETGPDEFLKHWRESFNWPMMGHILVTTLGENGYTYLRDDFLRESRIDSKKQERIKSSFESRVGDIFGIAPEKVAEALAVIQDGRRYPSP